MYHSFRSPQGKVVPKKQKYRAIFALEKRGGTVKLSGNGESVMLYETDLSGHQRIVPFPFPVQRLGTSIGEVRGDHKFFFTDNFEICIRLSSGEEKFAVDRINGVVYRTPFPHVLIKYPLLHFSNALPYPRNSFHFSYSLESLEKMKALGILPEAVAWEIELTPEISELIRRLTDLRNHSLERCVADRIDLACFQLLEELIFLREKLTRKHDDRKDKILAIASALNVRYNGEFDLESLALEHGMSRRTFFRYWGEYFSESPTAYVQNLKLSEAARQLRETSHPIGDITRYLNFSDAAYLSKLFRRRYGMTPLQYRKACQTEAADPVRIRNRNSENLPES